MTATTHSPLGASGAERWMNCPGSVGMLSGLELPPSDDPSYRTQGTAMHLAAERCLTAEVDAWELTGEEFEGHIFDGELALPVQAYLDYVRPLMAKAKRHWIERHVTAPVHLDFYGTVDFAALFEDLLEVVDLKGGAGIVVDPDDNAQLKYYAYGLIFGLEDEAGRNFSDAMPVKLTIVQPRAFHQGGTIRSWDTTVGAIKHWTLDTLVPAMDVTAFDNALQPGSWCRFCPAKLVCPAMNSLFGAAAKCDPNSVVNLSQESLGRSYAMLPAVRFYAKTLEEEVMRRLLQGDPVDGAKLVAKKANRVWKEEAIPLLPAQFGEEAWTKPELLGPAGLDKLGSKGKAFTRQYAYTPNTGYTVAPESDQRSAVPIQKASVAFADALKALEAG